MPLSRRISTLVLDRQRRSYQRLVAAPQAAPTRARVLATALVIQLSSAALSTLYLWWWCLGAGVEGRFPWLALGALHAGMATATMLAITRQSRPMARTVEALAAGRAPSELPAEQLAATLLQHRPMTRTMLAIWALGGPAQGLIVGAALGFHPAPWSMTVVITLLFGAITPTILRYELLVRIGFPMTSTLLPAGLLDPLGPIRLEKVYIHIWLLLIQLGGVLPASLILLARDPYISNLALTLIVADLVVVAAYTGGQTLRLISVPTGYLADQMDQVRQGRLDVSARIFSPDTFGLLTSDFNAMIEGLRQRERIRDTFGRYVTAQVAEEILSGRLDLGGQRRTATVLFADIQGFTRLAEQLPPEEVVSLLNAYLGGMVGCVLAEGGVVDKFIGDAIMALFGVPFSAGDPARDARAALRCALRMSQTLDALNASRAAAGLPHIELGIGLHTGELVAGNIGVPERMEYTVVGDTVNVAARLEGLTRNLARRVLLSEETASLVGDLCALERLDTVHVKGRAAPITVYTTAA